MVEGLDDLRIPFFYVKTDESVAEASLMEYIIDHLIMNSGQTILFSKRDPWYHRIRGKSTCAPKGGDNNEKFQGMEIPLSK